LFLPRVRDIFFFSSREVAAVIIQALETSPDHCHTKTKPRFDHRHA
jgi:hypothetical protein